MMRWWTWSYWSHRGRSHGRRLSLKEMMGNPLQSVHSLMVIAHATSHPDSTPPSPPLPSPPLPYPSPSPPPPSLPPYSCVPADSLLSYKTLNKLSRQLKRFAVSYASNGARLRCPTPAPPLPHPCPSPRRRKTPLGLQHALLLEDPWLPWELPKDAYYYLVSESTLATLYNTP